MADSRKIRDPDQVNANWLAQANLSAGRLTSYGFAVEAAFGHHPSRYLIGRRFRGSAAVTGLFVLGPENLTGTHVWIAEDLASRQCDVQTYVPTMKRSVRLVERYIFDCLPLTDIGYLDLMAWRYPGLGSPVEGVEIDMSWSRWRSARHCRYPGPPTTPGLTVTEAADPRTGLVVARAVARRREVFRRWEILEMGESDMVGLPKRIRVSRRESGSWTELHRTGRPVPIPEEDFDASPGQLRDALEHRLPAE
ncbi:hypothetical protein GCM10009780_15920 [Actinomadura alba]